MKSEQDRPSGKTGYEKPTAVDLGSTAPVVGASCVPGGVIVQEACGQVGNGAAGNCGEVGNSAGLACAFQGSSAGNVCNGANF